MHKTCIFFAYMQKFCINMQFWAVAEHVFLNKHFLTLYLTFYFIISLHSLIYYIIFVIQ